jgi:hypothetical protein
LREEDINYSMSIGELEIIEEDDQNEFAEKNTKNNNSG